MKTHYSSQWFYKPIKNILILTGFVMSGSNLDAQIASFPGAEGFGAGATGGRGGQVIFVTNTNLDGPGSLQEALNASGPRYILFTCSGVIDGTVEIPPGHGDFTLAGQTSPQGIIVRGFQSYNDEQASSSNFIIRHLRSRAGDMLLHPSPNWISGDGLTMGGVSNAIVDHCSFQHNDDEAVDISRTSNFTIQNSILGETLGEHGYLGGMLVNYSANASPCDNLSIHHNIWNRMGGRMPEFSCESPDCNNHTLNVEFSCNVFWDQQIETWYNPSIDPGGSTNTFYLKMNMANNYSHAQATYPNGMFSHAMLDNPGNSIYSNGNTMNLYPAYADYDLFYCCNDFPLNAPNTDYGSCMLPGARHNFPPVTYTPGNAAANYMYLNAGAFPRDAMDIRMMNPVGISSIVSLPVNQAGADDAFTIPNSGAGVPLDSDNDGMPDYWENAHGLNPNAQDHNGTNLSMVITGVNGYTNLECYINCLSDALVSGNTSLCGVEVGLEETPSMDAHLFIFPNPSTDQVTIRNLAMGQAPLYVHDLSGNLIITLPSNTEFEWNLNTSDWASGIYLLKVGNQTHKLLVE